ncbi:MAG: L-lactate dehydrogenase [Candidatus Magasanikbacteria bacterium GW2011_GWD2_43_18]|uniref:L-lactate dehydrogenase n=1 Tax=Candidatus Magasanikbacteria bacterium GW2011_GWE2_42_7 TaxID=1619052 RepID=A0A0G1BHD3_9BACT|nr:MAG: L-lactate dehydrogenase [Candidatus Magasanikbacteria bacterium GW2011_GWC2_42_27]KKS72825.1 MAG: L-lactate dehydrogenase [Candidatus Magasanikbacteria bacterium GW2011_GWE2_42_7]KKT04652.1 MAG: L-lactate dehydrogenase [Candidatus Magasanikbacteria bacterium GW2011_GWD2_43_18]KKT24410.1 MAG: L-lactate dehydrogenase [Candidatus Magasanikbacteria bacterium GW2011_GWA2_43_9]HBB37958.1 L-lactate dehydrogenase [Candidatus Magasanikbacteria bacterium]
MNTFFSPTKVAIIGAGAVGAAAAYAITLRNVVAEVILIDMNQEKEEGETMDISDGLSLVETGRVVRGEYSDARHADVIIVTAGAAQKPGDTRIDLLEKNANILKSIFKSIGKIQPHAIVLLISNPVDVLTYLAQEITGLPHNQVFGSGTTLDTARLRNALGEKFNVHANNINGFVLGEHGDSEFVAWSSVSIGGVPAKKLTGMTKKTMTNIEHDVRRKAYNIIQKKGATYFGIGLVAADIVEAIIYDQHTILPVTARLSSWNGISDICLGAPTIIGRSGVIEHWPLKLDMSERKKLATSAKLLRSYVKQVV